jgi:hypothetical protein
MAGTRRQPPRECKTVTISTGKTLNAASSFYDSKNSH